MVNAWTPWPRYEEREAGRHHSPLQPPRQHCPVESAVTINPFTAMLAEPSLRKRPVKVPQKLEIITAFFPLGKSTCKDFYQNAQY